MTRITLTLDGMRFHDIPGFYAEVNRVFMADEEWRLGDSLDALNDMFYGGYGALKGAASARLCWRAMAKSARDLGRQETRRWLTAKLDHPDRFNAGAIRRQIAALDDGSGPSFFQIVMDIIADHPRITLVPE